LENLCALASLRDKNFRVRLLFFPIPWKTPLHEFEAIMEAGLTRGLRPAGLQEIKAAVENGGEIVRHGVLSGSD